MRKSLAVLGAATSALLFLAVCGETTEERAAYLGAVCRGDADLRARLEELLLAHREAGSFLGEPHAVTPVTTAGAP